MRHMLADLSLPEINEAFAFFQYERREQRINERAAGKPVIRNTQQFKHAFKGIPIVKQEAQDHGG